MSEKELSAKEAYFEEQSLLDLSDDERNFQSDLGVIERALEDSKRMPPPDLEKLKGTFLGPTPKERRAAFEAHSTKHRVIKRDPDLVLARSSTVPEPELTKTFPVTNLRGVPHPSKAGNANKLKRVASLPDLSAINQTPFYQQFGAIPRELKHGKNVKAANNIKLVAEHKQLLKDKIVYFYPNDDISMARRMRIHKVIQLGAAWVNQWRADITHIMLDDASCTYSELLRHLNKAGFSRRLILVKFDPYIPQCIEFGTLLDPTAQRFSIRGAPMRCQSSQGNDSSQSSAPSQNSMKIKSSRRQIAAQELQKRDSSPAGDSLPSMQSVVETPQSSSGEVLVEDSFIVPCSNPVEKLREATSVSNQFNDALSQAIKETIAVAHLPLDDDEAESPLSIPWDDNEGPAEETLEPPVQSRRAPALLSKASALRSKSLHRNNFQCMDPGNIYYSTKNPNARTIQILDEMCKHYDQMQDQWRTLAYRKGIATLKKQTVKITTSKQAAALPFIGHRLADKIEEIVLTDRLRKLDNTNDDPLAPVLRLFLGVYGAGLAQANKWIQAGYRTLEDLKTKAKLTENHKIGLEHYTDFSTRIPRAEVEAHGAIVKTALANIDSEFRATIMGSYRRGAKDSGDIDMLITCPGASLSRLRTVVFDSLIPHLFNNGFLKATLAISRSGESTGTKWHGASCLPTSNVWRRMDFLLVPEEEMGAALIYFTGNDIFNRSIRLLARKMNMRLNQKGLYKDVQRERGGGRLNEGVLVEGRSEKRIFEVLGVPWREPHERIC